MYRRQQSHGTKLLVSLSRFEMRRAEAWHLSRLARSWMASTVVVVQKHEEMAARRAGRTQWLGCFLDEQAFATVATCRFRCRRHAGEAPARRKIDHSAGLFRLAQAISVLRAGWQYTSCSKWSCNAAKSCRGRLPKLSPREVMVSVQSHLAEFGVGDVLDRRPRSMRVQNASTRDISKESGTALLKWWTVLRYLAGLGLGSSDMPNNKSKNSWYSSDPLHMRYYLIVYLAMPPHDVGIRFCHQRARLYRF